MLFSTPLSAAALLLSASHVALATPVYALIGGSAMLVQRQSCNSYCGADYQFCCTGNEVCQTLAGNIATCTAGGAQPTAVPGGSWQYYTSTWVETDLVTKTSVWSQYVGPTAQASPTAVCQNAACGRSCCGWGEVCSDPNTGKCIAAGGVITQTIAPTTTVPFESAMPTGTNVDMVGSGGGGGLSGGAIAGIVIGVLAAIMLLMLICLFCCARAIFDSVLAIFGFGKKKRHTEETYIHSHHSHSGVGAGGRRWYGQGPAKPEKEKKSGFLGGAGAGAAVLGGLALALGLKRKHDRKHEEKSDYTSSYGTYSDYTTTSSSSSSDRRTRRSSRR